VPDKALLYCAGGGVGDSLMATVVARALRAKYDRVDALTLPGHRDALQHVPDLDRVLVDESQPENELANALSAERYDAAVVTWATPRTARVPHQARIPIRIGQARRLYSWRFTHRVLVRSELGDVTTHWSQILLDYARTIGCDTEKTAPAFVPTAEDEIEAKALLASLGLSTSRFAIVHSTNAIAPERGIWPTQGWSALVRGMQDRLGVRVLLSGAPTDAEIVASIAAESGGISIAGKTSLGAFGALAQSALAFAGITTGSMHIAAAVGCPTVGIFPFQTDTPERWAPVGERTAVVRATYPCRPGERKETCPDYACVANLNVPQILAALEQLLGTVVR
jgi:ADP-heptose:LPS heptosyltransferase